MDCDESCQYGNRKRFKKKQNKSSKLKEKKQKLKIERKNKMESPIVKLKATEMMLEETKHKKN